MKRLIIAATVVVALIVSAIALVITNASHTAEASQTEITEPEADASLPEFMEERLQDLVARGFVTQEQIDEMQGWFREHGPWDGELPEGFDPEQSRERFREHGPWSGEFPEDFDPERFLGDGFGGHGFGFFGGDGDLIDLFGVTPEELADALAEGTPLTDIVDDPEALLDSFVGLIQEGLNQAVEAGHLTQVEADQLIAEARSHAEAFINGEAFKGEGFMGPRGPRGFGSFRGFGEFGPPDRFDAEAEPAGHSA